MSKTIAGTKYAVALFQLAQEKIWWIKLKVNC